MYNDDFDVFSNPLNVSDKHAFSEDDFKKLWALNPIAENSDHDYNSTYMMLANILGYVTYTPDGDLVTFDLIYDRYKRYLSVKKVLTEGIEPRYIRKEDKVKNLFMYIYDKTYDINHQMPDTSRHFYFWDNFSEKEITNHYANFLKLCPKK